MFQLRARWALHLKCRVSSTTGTYLNFWGTAEDNSSNMMFGSLLYDPDKSLKRRLLMPDIGCLCESQWFLESSAQLETFLYICILLHKLKCIMGVFWSAVKSLMIFFLASLLLFYPRCYVFIFFLHSNESTTIFFSHFPDINPSQASQS